MSKETIKLQEALVRNDITWIDRLEERLDYSAFFFRRVRSNLENFSNKYRKI